METRTEHIAAIGITPWVRIDGVPVGGYPVPNRYGGDADGNVSIKMRDGSVRVFPWRQTVEIEVAAWT